MGNITQGKERPFIEQTKNTKRTKGDSFYWEKVNNCIDLKHIYSIGTLSVENKMGHFLWDKHIY